MDHDRDTLADRRPNVPSTTGPPRRLFLGIAVALLATAAVLAVSSQETRRSAPVQIAASNVSSLRLAWVAHTGVPLSTPTLADSVVYVGSADGHLYAYPGSCGTDATECRPLWTGLAGRGRLSTPAVSNGMVYVADAGARGSLLYAFRTSCGTPDSVCRPAWTGDIGGHVYGPWTAPTVANGTVVVGTRTGIFVFPALCRSLRCEPLWTASVGGWGAASWTVAGGIVYVSPAQTIINAARPRVPRVGVYAYSALCGTGDATCRPAWIGYVGDTFTTNPTVAGDVMYVGTNEGVFALPASCHLRPGCRPLWSRTTVGPTDTPVPSGDTVFVKGTLDVFAFPASCDSTGGICTGLWSAYSSDSLSPAPLVVAGGVAFVGTETGKVYAFAASCPRLCRPRWIETVGTGEVAVAASGRMLFAGSGDGLYAFAPRSVSPPLTTSDKLSALASYVALIGVGALFLAFRQRRLSGGRSLS